MAKGDWPRSYVVPSLALSGTAVVLLVWHVIDPDARVDAWTVALLAIAFLPWLRFVFESIDFPGGGSVTWRRNVEAQQRRQEADIEALRFLLVRFLTESERELLQQLVNGEHLPMDADDVDLTHRMSQNLTGLSRMKFIRTKPEIHELGRSGEPYNISTYNELLDVTESGHRYLQLLAQLPSDDGD